VASSLDEILSPEFGAALRRAREEKRLTIEEAASKLRMNPAFIEHMEKGRFDLLPPEPYRKGFIKSYSQLLEVKLTTPPPTEKRSVISSTISAVPEVTKKVTRDAVDLTKGVVESTVKTTGTVVQKFEEGVKDTFEEITSRDLWEEADEVRKERLGKRVLPFVSRSRQKKTPLLLQYLVNGAEVIVHRQLLKRLFMMMRSSKTTFRRHHTVCRILQRL
jgi:transcriptional regulator with XRE-family HTH domain